MIFSKKNCTIGLTGGIASGKSLFAQMLASLGAELVSADKLGHQVYAPGSAAYTLVCTVFGPSIVAPDGTIDRKQLGTQVFADTRKRRQLEHIVWPEIQNLLRLELTKPMHAPLRVVEAAVLIEGGWWDLFDEVWVVYAPCANTFTRLCQRDGLSIKQACQRLASQLSPAERLLHADRLINNSSDLASLQAEAEKLWHLYS